MAYVALTKVTVGDLFTEPDYEVIAQNHREGIPGKYTAKGQIAAGTGSQALGVVAAAANGKAITVDTSTATGLALAGGAVPIGMIIIWSGSIVSIPTGWQICDGTNGTPNLRDKFVIGAGGAYNPGDNSATGVNLAHTHGNAMTVGTNANAHTHTVGTSGAEAAHTHTVGGGVTGQASAAVQRTSGTSFAAITETHTHSGFQTPSQAGSSHTHASGATDSGGASHNHASTNSASALTSYLPSYYALAYIQRVS